MTIDWTQITLEPIKRKTCRTTSAAARESIRPHIAKDKLRVLERVKTSPATDQELQEALQMNPSTERPRRIELVDDGFLVDSGLRRKTQSGRDAIVWCAL